jgi:hypothetical protein
MPGAVKGLRTCAERCRLALVGAGGIPSGKAKIYGGDFSGLARPGRIRPQKPTQVAARPHIQKRDGETGKPLSIRAIATEVDRSFSGGA